MLLMARTTPTCVVIQMVVPRMDHGVIPLTLKFDGNIVTYTAALQEVLIFLNTLFKSRFNFGLKKWQTLDINFKSRRCFEVSLITIVCIN